MKKILSFILCLCTVISLCACSREKADTTQLENADHSDSYITENNNKTEKTDNASAEPSTEVSSTVVHEIADAPLSKEVFADNFSAEILTEISQNVNAIIAHISRRKKLADPSQITDDDLEAYKNSKRYKMLIALDVAFVKPAYYIVSQSSEDGLFERILCMALSDVTGIEKKDGTSTKQYLKVYNNRVLSYVKLFNKIVAVESWTEEKKLTQIKKLGIFAVGQLIDAMNRGIISQEGAIDCIAEIVMKRKGNDPRIDFAAWKADNEVNYRNILDTMA